MWFVDFYNHKKEMSSLKCRDYSKSINCGCYLTYPREEYDKEGGLRTKGIYKKDSEEYPLITYITVVYNRVETLKRCMESVFAQTYPNVEYIVVDGASTDGTLQLIEEYSEKLDYYISQPDNGIYNAMNKGISLARGRFLCFMNSDDECTPEAAEKIVLEHSRSKADLICGTRELYKDGKSCVELTYPRYPIKHSNFRYIQMYHQATYASYEVFEAVGRFDEKYKLLSDWIWESAAIDNEFKISFVNEVLTKFNYDGASAKGIEKRDEEWIEWTMCSFAEMSRKDAELFINSLDRERHPMFDLNVLYKVAQKYKKNLCFQKAFYEDSILACIEAHIDIEQMAKAAKYDLDRAVKNNYIIKKCGKFSEFHAIGKWLDEELKRSILLNEINYFEVKKEEIVLLKKIRDFQIKQCEKIYIRNIFKSLSFVYAAIYKCAVFYVCKLTGKSEKTSRLFYLKKRERWNKKG